MAQTLACVLTFAQSPSSFEAKFCGLSWGPSHVRGGLASVHNYTLKGNTYAHLNYICVLNLFLTILLIELMSCQ